MAGLCEHETFKDICGICHRDSIITTLRAEVEKLRAALEDIADGLGETDLIEVGRYAKHIARAALSASQPAPAPVRTDSRFNNAERIFGDD